MPPGAKYRWTHRTCTLCARRLKSLGFTTILGCQLSAGLHIPSCAPGIVRKANRLYPPTAKKWATVDLAGCVTYHPCRSIVPDARGSSRLVTRDHLDEICGEIPPLRDCALAGIGCSKATPMVSARCQYNQFKAMAGRIFRVPKHQPQARIFSLLWKFVPYLLPDFKATPMPFALWLSTCRAGRRAAMLVAKRKYDVTGWRAAYAKFKAFVKEEFLPDFEQLNGDCEPLKEMVDRLIQAPNDVTHVIAGPVLKPLLSRLKEIWNVEFPIFYGGTVPEKLQAWLDRLALAGGTMFTCDYSMFDNTHSAQSWDFLERLYAPSARGVQDWQKVMDAWRAPRGRIGPYTYRAPVMNASGRADTSLANAILNGLVMYLSVCAAHLGVSVASMTVEQARACRNQVFITVCGDDSLGRVPTLDKAEHEAFRSRLAANIALFGFESKIQVFSELEDCVYLGNRPYPVGGRWFWGRTIGRATYKMGWVIDTKGRDLLAHITGIADMHTTCSSHVPILSDLARRICQLREHAKRTPVVLDSAKPWEWTLPTGFDYDETTLQAVVRVTNRSLNACSPNQPMLTIQSLKDLIAEISTIPQLPYVLDSPVWRQLICADEL